MLKPSSQTLLIKLSKRLVSALLGLSYFKYQLYFIITTLSVYIIWLYFIFRNDKLFSINNVIYVCSDALLCCHKPNTNLTSATFSLLNEIGFTSNSEEWGGDTTGNQASFCNQRWIGETADYHTENIYTLHTYYWFSISVLKLLHSSPKKFYFYMKLKYYVILFCKLCKALTCCVPRVPYFEENSLTYERERETTPQAPSASTSSLTGCDIFALHWLGCSY